MTPEMRERVRLSRNAGDIYEHIIAGLYKNLLPPEGIAVDGGANTGWHAFQMADVLTSGVVHSFEPSPEIFKIHKPRASRYGDRVVANQVALGDFVGEAPFNFFHEPNPKYPDDPLWNTGLSGLKSDAERLKLGHIVVQVPVTTLDEYFGAHMIPRLDFVKLDLEGGEYHAMKGGTQTLRSMRPLVAFEDGGPGVGMTYGYASADFPHLLESIGYDLYDILGEPYQLDQWIARDRWRPFYSIAVPKGYAVQEKMDPIIERTVQGKLA